MRRMIDVPKDEGHYRLITFDEDDNVLTHLLWIG